MKAVTRPTLLTSTHDLSSFDCGHEALNHWLKNRALDSEGKTARTYVVCDNNIVVGYYCISSASVERADLPRALRQHGPPNSIPVAIIGRLARDLRYRGTELGLDLLRDALGKILQASETIGIRAVLVHAIDEAAAKFWADNAFIESPIGSRTFFLPLETVLDGLN